MEKVRIDKWLWAVRVFKSRTLATDTCKAGNVKLKSKSQKPSSLVTIGDMIEVKKNGFNLQFEIVKVIDKRVSAVLAAECYRDLTPEEELKKYDNWFVGKSRSEIREKGLGRPTKRERRDIDEFKIRSYDEFDLEEET